MIVSSWKESDLIRLAEKFRKDVDKQEDQDDFDQKADEPNQTVMSPFGRVECFQRATSTRTAGARPETPSLRLIAEREFEPREEVETFLGFERGGRAAQQGSRFVRVAGQGEREGCEDGFAGGHVVSPEP